MIEPLLKRLEEAQLEAAKAAMTPGDNHDSYYYGRAVGLYAGLERARSILLNVLRDQEARDSDL